MNESDRLLVPGRLAALEAIVERGIGTFVEVGEALAEIRDSRLYRETHATFDEYLRDRWGFTRQRAHQMIEAAGVVKALPASTSVDNEAQARALAPILREYGPERAAAVLVKANETTGGHVTAEAIREAASAPNVQAKFDRLERLYREADDLVAAFNEASGYAHGEYQIPRTLEELAARCDEADKWTSALKLARARIADAVLGTLEDRGPAVDDLRAQVTPALLAQLHRARWEAA